MIEYKNVLVLEESDLLINTTGDNVLDFRISSEQLFDSDLIIFKGKVFKDRYRKV
jgi:hypothetical protein